MLENLKPKKVMHYFEEICSIPHGSGNMEAISAYCVDFAEKRGLKVRRDEMYNVVIVKEASEGYEDAPTVILQGHMDMVCEKNNDVAFDFEKEGLKLGIDGDFIYAEGTTLGGDDGIAVAMIMAILDDDTIKHPRLEAIFTTEEERGMDGAQFLDTSDLCGKYMINLDSEEEGSILTSCAGGIHSEASFDVSYTEAEGIYTKIEVKGLLGGHSGAEIHKMRANANVLMGRILFGLIQQLDISVISINGGMKDNAIPREAVLELCVPEEEMQTLNEVLDQIASEIKNEFKTSDPGIVVSKTFDSTVKTMSVMHMSSLQRILFVLFNAPNGIQTMSADIPGLVESSLNLGILRTDGDTVSLGYGVRSSVKSLRTLISDKLQYMTEMMGGIYNCEGEYPAWEYKKESSLRILAGDVFEELYGRRPGMGAIHAGLECGLISEKIPGIDIISIGPDIYDIHTPDEKLSISSTERTYHYVVKMLEEFPKYCK